MTDQELKDLVASLAIQSAKNEAFLTKKFAETDAMIDRLGEKIQNLADMYGGMGNNLGEEAELNFTQILSKTPALSNVSFDSVEANLYKHKDHKKVEIDIFMLNGNAMAIIEVKRHLQSKHIKQLHEKTIPNFLALYPEYKGKKLYAALATYGISRKAKPFVDRLIKEYGYGLITPDSSGLDIEVDTSYLRVLN